MHTSVIEVDRTFNLGAANFGTFDVVEMALYVTEKSIICLVVAIPVQINWTHHDRCCM
jgi:hypothetical protein